MEMQRIDTQAELDALPEGAAILDSYGQILTCDGPRFWLEPGGSDLDPLLPALLLWHPDWNGWVEVRRAGDMNVEQLIAVFEGTERVCLEEYERRRNSVVWAATAARWKHKAEGIRFAIDTTRALSSQSAG
jgi:hypothetical protein